MTSTDAAGRWRVVFAASLALLGLAAKPLVAAATRVGVPVSLPRAVDDDWLELRTPGFVTLTNAGERKGREIALGFERFRAALRIVHPGGVPEPPEPTRILVFRNDRSFDPYKPGEGDSRKLLLGVFEHTHAIDYILINGYPARGSALPVVYHEYEHAVTHASFSNLPLWLDEGLAELYSTFAVDGSDLLVGKPIDAHVRTLREEPFVPLARLFAVDRSSPEYQESSRVGTFYAESWALVHYLLMGGPQRLQGTIAFLSSIQQGDAPEAAFRAAFGHGFDQLEKELRGYVNGPTMPYLKLPQAQLGPEPPVTVRPLPPAEVLFELGSALALQGRSGGELARRHLEAAAAAGIPDAWAMLGLAEEAADHPAAAAELYHRALAAGATRPAAVVAAVRAQLVAPGAAASALEARQRLRRVVAAEPGYAEARAVLGRTWLLTDGDPGPGIAELTRALELLPDRADVAYDLAMLELRAGEVARAETLVRTRVAANGSPELVAQARAAIERTRAKAEVDAALASGDADRAAAALAGALAWATDPELRQELQAHLHEARAFQVRQAQGRRYDAAIAQANAGRLPEARAALRALRAEVSDAGLLAAIDEALAQLEAAPAGASRRPRRPPPQAPPSP